MSQQQTIRRVVWTGAIAATTAVGAWYGAGLKTQQEMKKVSFTILRYFCVLGDVVILVLMDVWCRKSTRDTKPRQPRKLLTWKRAVVRLLRRDSGSRGRLKRLSGGRWVPLWQRVRLGASGPDRMLHRAGPSWKEKWKSRSFWSCRDLRPVVSSGRLSTETKP